MLACVVKPKFGTFSPISFPEAAILLVSYGERIIAFSLGLGGDDGLIDNVMLRRMLSQAMITLTCMR